MKREDLEIIRDFKYVNEYGHYVLTKEQLYKIIDENNRLSLELIKKKKEVDFLIGFRTSNF